MPDLSPLGELLRAIIELFGLQGTTPRMTLFTLLFGGGFLLAAFIMLIFAAISIMRALAAQNWPTADGVVLSGHIAESYSSEGGTSYRPVVKYQYQVGEKQYINDLLSFGSRNYYGGHGGAMKTLQRYPAGAGVRVHYKPGKPEDSVLEVRSSIGCLLTFMGVLFTCIGIGGGLMGMFMP